MQRADEVDGVSDNRDQLGVRIQAMNPGSCYTRVEIPDRRFTEMSFRAAMGCEQLQIVFEGFHRSIPRKVVGEEHRLLASRHEDAGVTPQVGVEGRCTSLRWSNNEEIGYRHELGVRLPGGQESGGKSQPSSVIA